MNNELQHHGILGMKWGIRRYQPYPSGERVKGGKEVGAATKVKQRGIVSTEKPDFRDPVRKKMDRLTQKNNEDLKRSAQNLVKEKIFKTKGIPNRLEAEQSASKQTKQVVSDYNALTNQEFKNKYSISKEQYAKRFDKYNGDPYKNATMKDKAVDAVKNLPNAISSNTDTKKNIAANGRQETSKLLKSSTYSKEFLNYIKKDVVKPEMVDDPDLMELLIDDFYEATGKQAIKN